MEPELRTVIMSKLKVFFERNQNYPINFNKKRQVLRFTF